MTTPIFSPNMNLPVPVPIESPGPEYADNIQSSLNLIDSHNHTSGQGVPIPLGALSVSQNLDMAGYSVINLKSVVLNNQLVAPSSNGSVYMSGNNLYWKDGTGAFNVQITNGNAVAAAPGSISGLFSPASAAYVTGTGTFVFQSNVNVAANLDARNITLRNITVSSYGYEVIPPTLVANTSITMPLRPAATKIMSMTSAGVISANIDADNSTIEISSNNLQVKDSGITTLKIANNNVTKQKLSALGQQISSSSGAFTTTSLTPVAVTNLSVTLTTTGRPIMILLIADGSGGSNAYLGASRSVAGTSATATFYVEITGVTSNSINQGIRIDGASGVLINRVLPGCLNHVHVAVAGTYTVSIGASGGLTSTAEVNNCKLVAYEL
jgi:hypothetical protein